MRVRGHFESAFRVKLWCRDFFDLMVLASVEAISDDGDGQGSTPAPKPKAKPKLAPKSKGAPKGKADAKPKPKADAKKVLPMKMQNEEPKEEPKVEPRAKTVLKRPAAATSDDIAPKKKPESLGISKSRYKNGTWCFKLKNKQVLLPPCPIEN